MLKKSHAVTIVLSVFVSFILVAEIIFWILAQSNFWEYVYAFTYFLLFFIAAFAGLWGGYSVGLQNTFGKALYSLGLANIFLLLSITSVDYYSYVANTPLPYPSISNLFYLLYVPLTAIGLGFTLRLYDLHVDKKVLAKMIALIAASTFIIFYFLGFPSIREGSVLPDVTDLLYTLGDAILLSVVLIIFSVAKMKTYRGLYLYLIGISLHILGDIIFVTRAKQGLYSGFGDPAEIIYIVSALALSLGIVMLQDTFRVRVKELKID